MNRRYILIIFGLIILILFVFAERGLAQIKIGYIDSQKILSSYAPAIDAEKQLETENNKWSEQLKQMEADFQVQKEKLEQQSLLLSDEKKREKQQELQKLAFDAQQLQNEKWGEQGEYFKVREQLLKPIIDNINAAINEISKDEGYDFVFDTVAGNLLYAEDKYDLTDKVLEELEKEESENSEKNQ